MYSYVDNIWVWMMIHNKDSLLALLNTHTPPHILPALAFVLVAVTACALVTIGAATIIRLLGFAFIIAFHMAV